MRGKGLAHGHTDQKKQSLGSNLNLLNPRLSSLPLFFFSTAIVEAKLKYWSVLYEILTKCYWNGIGDQLRFRHKSQRVLSNSARILPHTLHLILTKGLLPETHYRRRGKGSIMTLMASGPGFSFQCGTISQESKTGWQQNVF